MASLSASARLGNATPSSLVKSAASLQTAIANYTDQVQALTYANSAYTDDAFKTYQTYLQGRVNSLQATGSVANMSKALTMTKTMESAMHSNISASITRENIQIMAGNAALPDKYNLIVGQYQRAMSNGDLTLAQTLEGQAYSVNQQIDYQAQQAANAAAALAKASAGYGGYGGYGSSTANPNTANATRQGEIASNLTGFLKSMTGTAKNMSEKELNNYATNWVGQNKDTLNALGVHITNQQPNYWDLVYGVAGAAYNAKVLQAQSESLVNPLLSRTYAMDAQNMVTGATKFDTLAGSLTVQEIQQAQQDPSMLIYNNTTGTYQKSQVIGYQYMNMDNGKGGQSPVLTPTYSGVATAGQRNQIYFLTPQETSMATKLGLIFEQKVNKNGTIGDGATVQVSETSPAWLQNILGKNGTAQIFTDSKGFITFKAGNANGQADANGQGESFYTLAMDNKGLGGLYQHLSDGSAQLVGGDYGFAATAVNMLINQGQQTQYKVQVAAAQAQAALKAQQAAAQAQLVRQQQSAAAQAQAQAQARANAAAHQPAPPPQHQLLQRTYNPQVPTYNPQVPTFNPQQAGSGLGLQGGNVGAGLNQSGTGGIKLGSSSGPTIRL